MGYWASATLVYGCDYDVKTILEILQLGTQFENKSTERKENDLNVEDAEREKEDKKKKKNNLRKLVKYVQELIEEGTLKAKLCKLLNKKKNAFKIKVYIDYPQGVDAEPIESLDEVRILICSYVQDGGNGAEIDCPDTYAEINDDLIKICQQIGLKPSQPKLRLFCHYG